MGCQQSKLGARKEPPLKTKHGHRFRTKRVLGFTQRYSGKQNAVLQQNVQKFEANKESNHELIDNCLENHFLFHKFTRLERAKLIEFMVSYRTRKGQYVFKQGQKASLFFIISKGKVHLQFKEQQKKQRKLDSYVLNRWQCFGDVALLYATERSASVRALKDCEFWCLSNQVFKKATEELVKRTFKLSREYINTILIFRFLPRAEKDAIAYNMLQHKYKQNDILFSKKDRATSFFVLISGQIQINITDQKTVIFKAGQSFGENIFTQKQTREGTAIVTSAEAVCLSISQQGIKNCLGEQFQQLFYFNIAKWSFQNSTTFEGAPRILLEKLVLLMEIKQCEQNEIICTEGQQAGYFIICLHGKVSGSEVGSFLNEDTLESHNNLKATQTYRKQNGNGPVGLLKWNKIENMLGQYMETIYKQKMFNKFKDQDLQFEQQLARLEKKQLGRKDQVECELEDLLVTGYLGESLCGQVYQVQNRKSPNCYYAIKCIETRTLSEKHIGECIQREKEILQMVNFPFIMTLKKSFVDTHHSYLLTQLSSGGDLLDLVEELGQLTDQAAQFYTASLILSLEYLHSKNIVYRNIKLQNYSLNSQGYLCLTDFGTAKILTQQTGRRTFTLIGSAHYMAPEIIQGKGYSFACDRWSLGVALYQMLCGQFPFGQEVDDPYQIYQEIILSKEIIFPANYSNQKGQNFITKLLNKNWNIRDQLKWRQLKKQSYFEGFSWEALLYRKLQPPHIPRNVKKTYEFPTNQIGIQKFLQRARKETKNQKINTIQDILIQN